MKLNQTGVMIFSSLCIVFAHFNINNATDCLLIGLTARADDSVVCSFRACVTCTDEQISGGKFDCLFVN